MSKGQKKSIQIELSDAVKRPMSMRGYALMQWDFRPEVGFPLHSTLMPEAVIDQILKWRDDAMEKQAEMLG